MSTTRTATALPTTRRPRVRAVIRHYLEMPVATAAAMLLRPHEYTHTHHAAQQA